MKATQKMIMQEYKSDFNLIKEPHIIVVEL